MLPKNQAAGNTVLQCPNCEVEMKLPKNGIKSLIKNFALISLAESQALKPPKPEKKPEEVKKYDKEKFKKEFKQGFVSKKSDPVGYEGEDEEIAPIKI